MEGLIDSLGERERRDGWSSWPPKKTVSPPPLPPEKIGSLNKRSFPLSSLSFLLFFLATKKSLLLEEA